MNFRRFQSPWIGLVFASALASPLALAAEVLDQENVFPNPSIGDHSNDVFQYGQTFTVGVTGTLTRVEVYLAKISGIPPGVTENLVFRLYETSDGLPTTQMGTDLTLPPSEVSGTAPEFESFDVSSFGIEVTEGDVLAFVITKSPNLSSLGYVLPFQSPGAYAGGQPVQRLLDATPTWEPVAGVPRDYGFRTYVEAGESLPGDLDGDGDVDLADLGIILADYGCTSPPPCAGDADGDGDTDLGDLGVVLANYGG